MSYHPDATDVASLMLAICWGCVNVTTYISPRFRCVVPSLAELSTLFSLATFSYCPGLYDAIRAPTPPSVEWLEALPDDLPIHHWGVYVLVLRKSGHVPLVYVGSGTAFYQGVRARVKAHVNGNVNTTDSIRQATQDGYKIVHYALLAYCPTPAPANLPKLRTVVMVMEAAFTAVFWALYRHDRTYGLAHQCPWPRDLFEWSGLCSHSPLLEGVYDGGLDFTAEQLEEMVVAIKQKDRKYQERYQKELRANPTEKFRARVKRNNEKQKAGTQARQQAAIESKQYYCAVCDVACRDNASLVLHNKTKRHLKKVQMGDSDYICEPCGISFAYLSAIKAHYKSKGHIRRTQA